MPELHITDELLDEYALGALTEDRLAEVEEHLLICQDCQARLQAADEFAMLFRACAVQPDARPQRGWRLTWKYNAARWTMAAAMLSILLLLVWPFRKPATVPATVFMQSLRGPEASAQVVAGKPAFLAFDIAPTSGANQYEARIVNPVGTEILTAKVFSRDGRPTVLLHGLPPGSYWVRIYRIEDREEIAEYGLQAK